MLTVGLCDAGNIAFASLSDIRIDAAVTAIGRSGIRLCHTGQVAVAGLGHRRLERI